jgi:hypothetical protein
LPPRLSRLTTRDAIEARWNRCYRGEKNADSTAPTAQKDGKSMEVRRDCPPELKAK